MKCITLSDIRPSLRGDDCTVNNTFFNCLIAIQLKRRQQILVLAGGLGDPRSLVYRDFIQRCSEHFFAVIWIAGHAEYIDCETEENMRIREEFMDTLARRHTNVHFLQQSTIVIECTTRTVHGRTNIQRCFFAGCTLWTPLAFDSDLSQHKLFMRVPALKNLVLYNGLHDDHRSWLSGALEEACADTKMSRVVAVTYTSPMCDVHDFEDHDNNAVTEVDAEELLDRANYWFCGGFRHPMFIGNSSGAPIISNPVFSVPPEALLDTLSTIHPWTDKRSEAVPVKHVRCFVNEFSGSQMTKTASFSNLDSTSPVKLQRATTSTNLPVEELVPKKPTLPRLKSLLGRTRSSSLIITSSENMIPSPPLSPTKSPLRPIQRTLSVSLLQTV